MLSVGCWLVSGLKVACFSRLLVLSKNCHSTAQSLHVGLSRVEQERGEPPGDGVGTVLDNDLGEDGHDDLEVESPESEGWHQSPGRVERVLRSLRDLWTSIS